MASAKMTCRVLEDGTISILTDEAVPEEHHKSADELLAFIEEKMGTKRETTPLREGHVHDHNHDHQHVHHSH